MKINGQEVTEKQFAFEGCHKIYLLADEAQVDEARACGYGIFPVAELEDVYASSCSLRFISRWALDKSYVEQFTEDVIFTDTETV